MGEREPALCGSSPRTSGGRCRASTSSCARDLTPCRRGRTRRRRSRVPLCTWFAVLVVAPALAIASARFEQYVKFGLSVDHLTYGCVFDLHGTRKDPHDTTPSFISMLRCDVPRYQMQFAFTPVRGQVVRFPYPVRIGRGRVDGELRRCPFATLPTRGLRSLQVAIFVHNKILLRLSARPPRRAGETFEALQVPVMNLYQATAPGGHVRIQMSARSARASHRVDLLADTKPPR
jgi:hypothetical protein